MDFWVRELLLLGRLPVSRVIVTAPELSDFLVNLVSHVFPQLLAVPIAIVDVEPQPVVVFEFS